jgi:hypothetical protein
MGTCLSSNGGLDSHVAELERDMAWSFIGYRTYEDRVTRQIFEEDHEVVSLGVLAKSFHGIRAFADLNVEGSLLRRMVTSKYLEKSAHVEGTHIEQHKIRVKALLLLGILYCKGDAQLKATAFYDVIQGDLKEEIPNNDGDLRELYPLVLQLATSYISYWAYVHSGKRVHQEDVDKYEEDMKEVYEAIHENLIDDIFGEHASKITRHEFIHKLAGEHSKYLDSNHIKTLVQVK